MSFKKLCNIPNIPDYTLWSKKTIKSQEQLQKEQQAHVEMQIKDSRFLKEKYNVQEIDGIDKSVFVEHWEITDNKVIKQISEYLGLRKATGRIHVLPPGRMVPVHFDNLWNGLDFKDNFDNHEFTQDERNYFKEDSDFLQRVFIFLDDHKPGQLICFDGELLADWRKGDVVYWKWQTVDHFTVNAGYWNRPLLRLTGLVTEKFLNML